jgi:hypothetical protein
MSVRYGGRRPLGRQSEVGVNLASASIALVRCGPATRSIAPEENKGRQRPLNQL